MNPDGSFSRRQSADHGQAERSKGSQAGLNTAGASLPFGADAACFSAEPDHAGSEGEWSWGREAERAEDWNRPALEALGNILRLDQEDKDTTMAVRLWIDDHPEAALSLYTKALTAMGVKVRVVLPATMTALIAQRADVQDVVGSTAGDHESTSPSMLRGLSGTSSTPALEAGGASASPTPALVSPPPDAPSPVGPSLPPLDDAQPKRPAEGSVVDTRTASRPRLSSP